MTKFFKATVLTLISLCIFIGCHEVVGKTPSWDKCTKSSNWHGRNAEWRMMNILSPHMSDEIFKQRLSFIKERGCNTAHVILCNKADGEFAGYSIYGNGISWTIDKNYTSIMTKRLKKLRNEKLAIVLWLLTDDSSAWNRELAKNPQKYVNDIASLGWFDIASTVCIGLELDEYFNAAQVNSFAIALRNKYKGKIATHHTSGKSQFVGLGDILFYQIEPTDNHTIVANACKNACKHGKPVNFFECYRQENRANCETAFANGCFAVGNW